MDRVKIYSKYDLTTNMNINNIINFTNNFNYEIEEYNINDVLEYFNIIKFSKDNEIKERIINETNKKFDEVLKIIQRRIGKFNGKNKESFLSLYNEVDFIYREDFFELIKRDDILNNIKDLDFEELLNNPNFHYNLILKHEKIVKKFDEIITKYMIEDSECAEIIIGKYIYEKNQNRDEIYLPKSLTQNNKEEIIVKYIESENVNLRYLGMVINFPNKFKELNISDKIKLKAKGRYIQESNKIFKNSTGIETEVEVTYDKNQEEPVIYSVDKNICRVSVSRKWIEGNLDFNTLLNNFIYIFSFFDMQMRLSLVSNLSEIGSLERHVFLENSEHFYKISLAFRHKDIISKCQMYSYIEILEKHNIRIEEIIEWFFKYYLKDEFGIENFIVDMPTVNTSYFEKCKLIAIEIDKIIKQYQYYIQDGEIDEELLQISSNSIIFRNCMSIVNNKYVYPNSKVFDIASYLLFSAQSMMGYLPHIGIEYNEFYKLIIKEKVKLLDFENYQIGHIEWLIENKFIMEDKNGYLQFVNENKIYIFLDLYKNGVMSYWNCRKELRDEINILINENIVKFDNKLFTNDEQDYLNYHLNNSDFGNSLALRNRYVHGSQSNDDKLHKENYFIFLKIVIIIIVKINDDLCIKQIAEEKK